MIPSFFFSQENTIDWCMYMKWEQFYFFLILYVDDIILATNDFGLLYEIKKHLSKNFKIKDIEETTYVIGT